MLLDYKPVINTIRFLDVTIGILRLDDIHKDVSGNKWFKLNYNLLEAKRQNKTTILTFGGAFSNHIAATAAACQLFGFKSIGCIRGDELGANNNTLLFAQMSGMLFNFLSREQYKQKNNPDFLSQLQQTYPDAYIIPEGGDNQFGELGCTEILTTETYDYKTIFCAHGTGTTFKGIAQSLNPHQTLCGINVLKYEATSTLNNAAINNNYHFGGYAKHTLALLDFKHWFEKTYHIPLDYVYTTKLFFAVFDLIKQGLVKNENNPLIIHSGGLQGNIGYQTRYNLNSI